MLFSRLPYPVPSNLTEQILRLQLQEPTNNMATIPIATIVQWCGMSTRTARNRIIDDMMSPPEGLKHLNGETSEEMLGTFINYAQRDKDYGKVIFTRVQQRRFISLMDWVKDETHLEEEASFPDGTTREEVIYKLEEATTRKNCRKEQKKVGESLITTFFQVQLEASRQWDHWVVELESNLKMIVGAQGIPLSYIIR